MESKILQIENVTLRVTESGDIFQIKNGKEIPKPKIAIGKDRKYLAVVLYDNGKQKNMFVHRLVAMAFVPNPNPEVCKCVTHLDGDLKNNCANNLAWVSRSELARNLSKLTMQSPYDHYPVCSICGIKHTKSADRLCCGCRRKIKAGQKKQLKLKQTVETLGCINQEILTPIQKRYVQLRLQGHNESEIAKMFGVSRQAVNETIKHAINRKETIKLKIFNRLKCLRVECDELDNLLKSLGVKTTDSGEFPSQLEGGKNDEITH